MNNRLIAVIAVLITAVCLITILKRQFGGRPKVNVQPFAELGGLVADETTKVLGHSGRVVVLTVDTATYKVATLDTLLAVFKKTLARKGNFTIQTVEKFRVPPTMFMALSSGALVPPGVEWPAGRFANILAAHENADAIVSFVGLPPLSPENLGEVNPKKIKIVIVSHRDPDLSSLLKAGLIELAIVPRDQTDSQPQAKSGAAREHARQNYEILTR